MRSVLALDYGATSGRGIVCSIQNGKIHMEEIYRFPNSPVRHGGTLCWDFNAIMEHTCRCLSLADRLCDVESIAIDTWGLDFGLLGKDGVLMEPPVSYRDDRTAGMMEEVFKIVPAPELYERTAVQFLQENTIYQLMALKKTRPELLEKAGRLLMMPDLIYYYLTGYGGTEYTVATTTQLVNARDRQWDQEILRRLGLPGRLFGSVETECSRPLLPDLCRKLGIRQRTVRKIASHDSACCACAIPAEDESFLYINSGTWSIIGTQLPAPHISRRSFESNMANEGGYGGTIRYLRSVNGMFPVEQCRKEWGEQGMDVSFETLNDMAQKAWPPPSFVDPEAEELKKPGGMPDKIRKACRERGQSVPETPGEILSCIYTGLAFRCRYEIEAMEEELGRSYRTIYLVGGGARNEVLNRILADVMNKNIVVGPDEATALGNACMQFVQTGIADSLAEVRRMTGYGQKTYEPAAGAYWETAYHNYKKGLK